MRGRERGRRSVDELGFLRGLPAKQPFDSLFTQTGVIYFTAAGDSLGALYPSVSPNVVAVGGTSLVRNPLPWRGSLGDFQGEDVWNGDPPKVPAAAPASTSPAPLISS
jgi:hypothetical protein